MAACRARTTWLALALLWTSGGLNGMASTSCSASTRTDRVAPGKVAYGIMVYQRPGKPVDTVFRQFQVGIAARARRVQGLQQ
jgi:hypothetical protein